MQIEKTKNYIIKKFLPLLIIVSIFAPIFIFFSIPKQASAQWITTDPVTGVNTGIGATQQTVATVLSIKEVAKKVVQQVLMNLAKRFLQKMTTSMTNWINSGFHGSPLFLENPQSFFKDIAKYETQTFIDEIGYNSLRYPFGKNVALNIIGSYKTQFANNAEYTLSRVINDPTLLNNFRNDFNVGGWNGFLINTQYPQNNYLGFQMTATQELARRLQGTSQNNAQKVATTLQQGMGFLSPQTCPSNPNYPIATNPYDPPSFKVTPWDPPKPKTSDYICTSFNSCELTEEFKGRYDQYQQNWETTSNVNRENFEEKYSCPGGLVDTTPGAVVGNSIMTALDSNYRQSELSAAMGNSISAILDSLLNHFMEKGLNALATKVNPPPSRDEEWTYDGQTLGTSQPYGSTAWNMGPDEVVVLSEFKKDVSDGIANTNLDLILISNEDPNNPGILQVMTEIWQKTKELDQCIPGPDLGWQERLKEEKERSANKLQEKSIDDDPVEAAWAREAFRELNFAVGLFTDYIEGRMMSELPNSVNYMEAVTSIESVHQESTTMVNKRRTKIAALARLKSIQTNLANFTVEPDPGSAVEKRLIELRKQYYATLGTISHPESLDETRNDLNTAKDRLENLKTMTLQCLDERKNIVQWDVPDKSGQGTSKLLRPGTPNVTERQVFCEGPITGGYSHGETDNGRAKSKGVSVIFRSPYKPAPYADVPLVNAGRIFNYDTAFGSAWVSMNISCKSVWKANVLDYKGDIPGITGPTGEIPATDSGDPGNSGSGTSTGPGTPGAQEPASLIGQIAAERNKYPMGPISRTDIGNILATVASNNAGGGWGLYSKTSGETCPSSFGSVSCDVMIHAPTCYAYDVLSDATGGNGAGGTAAPSWGFVGGGTRSPWRGPGGSTSSDTSPCASVIGGGGSSGGGSANVSPLEGEVGAERGKYPSSFSALCPNGGGLQPTSCPLGYILNAVAWNNQGAGWGLNSKTSGHRCPSPAGEIACDILHHQASNHLFDVFIDAEGKATTTWDDIGVNGNSGRPWVAPAQP